LVFDDVALFITYKEVAFESIYTFDAVARPELVGGVLDLF